MRVSKNSKKRKCGLNVNNLKKTITKEKGKQNILYFASCSFVYPMISPFLLLIGSKGFLFKKKIWELVCAKIVSSFRTYIYTFMCK